MVEWLTLPTEDSTGAPLFPARQGMSTLGMSFLDAMTGFVVGSSGKISKTTDGGVTWPALPPPQTDFGFFQMKIISPTEIYAVGAPDFLYKSTDLGSTWTPLPIIPVTGSSGALDTLVFYSLEKQGSRLIMSGDLGVIAESTDGGLSWTSKNFQLTTAADVRYQRGAEHAAQSWQSAVNGRSGRGRCFVRPIGVTPGARSTLG